MRSVTITVDRSALRHNLAQVRAMAPDCQIFAIIKADAYGHGAVACAKALSTSDGLGVVVPGEAIALRTAGIQMPILVIQGPRTATDITICAQYDCQVGIHAWHQLDLLEQHATTLTRDLSVWIKLDTGMGRLGFFPEDLPRVQQRLNALTTVNVIGCMTHFSCADEPDNTHTSQQIARFNQTVPTPAKTRSLANSAAVIGWPEARVGWVRPGIMLYGSNPLASSHPLALKPVMHVTAPLIAVRDLKAGDTVGYGNTWRCTQAQRIGVVAIGYGDGYPRHIAAETPVMVGDQRCRILGRVSMDSLVIDVSQLAVEPRIGDAVTLWGPGLSVDEVASCAGTISYELLCQIRGERQYID